MKVSVKVDTSRFASQDLSLRSLMTGDLQHRSDHMLENGFTITVRPEPVEGYLVWFDKLTTNGKGLSFLKFNIVEV